jgi:hypothetical protein
VIASRLREGIVERKLDVRPGGEVGCDEVVGSERDFRSGGNRTGDALPAGGVRSGVPGAAPTRHRRGKRFTRWLAIGFREGGGLEHAAAGLPSGSMLAVGERTQLVRAGSGRRLEDHAE